MPASAPKSMNIRTYQVGFGDCFLLSFNYDSGKKKHVLIDFGTKALPKGSPKDLMLQDRKQHQGGRRQTIWLRWSRPTVIRITSRASSAAREMGQVTSSAA